MSAVDQRKGDAGAFTNRVANFIGQNKIRTNQIERQDCDSLAPVIQYQGARKQFNEALRLDPGNKTARGYLGAAGK